MSPLRFRRVATGWHAVTFAVVAVGLVWQLVLIIQGVNVLLAADGSVPSIATRVIRFFSFFTVESNLLVGVTAATLVLRPRANGRLWRVLRLEALFGIAVTGVVYATLLRGVVDLHGASAITNALVHYAAPLLAVIGWLVFGPRPRITENTLIVSLVWPALYVGWTLLHGAVTHWYPYPFVDVTRYGYVTVVRNGIGLNLLLVGIGAVFLRLDHRLPDGGAELLAGELPDR